MGREERLKGLPGGLSGVPIIGGPRNPLDRPAQVRDQIGRVLQEADIITLHTQNPQLFRVDQIKPVVESGVPAGFMEVRLSCTLAFRAPRDVPNLEFLKVGSQAPTPPQTFEEPPVDSAHAEPDSVQEPEPAV
jgi:hypothetical protein